MKTTRIRYDGSMTDAEIRLELSRRALVATGYFTRDEVGLDVAPRITELWSAIPKRARREVLR